MRSPKTLSFWLTLVGLTGLSRERTRYSAAMLLLAAGWGGAGGAYFRACDREGVATEPLAVLPYLSRDDWRSILSHAILIVPAVWALRKGD